jgi:ABC-type sugar transport system, periplasmic component
MDAVWKEAAAAYQATHPNFQLTIFSTADLRGFEQKLATALPSKTAGDIIFADNPFMAQFVDQNLMAPPPPSLQALINGGAFNKVTINQVTSNGKIWSVPNRSSTKALYYNTDMFTAAGITEPPHTMDEILADAAKLVQRDASGKVVRSGISLRWSGQGSGVGQKFEVWMEQFGGSLLTQTSPGKWKADYNTEAGLKAFEIYVNALKDKIDDPRIASDTKAFESQGTAMYVREPNVVADIAKNAPTLVGHYGTVSLPVGSLFGMTSLFVPAASPNQAAAWDFINFLSEPAQQLSIPTIAGWLPGRIDLDTKDFLAKNPTYAGFLNMPAEFTLYVDPVLPEWDEIETKLSTHLVAAFTDTSLAGNPSKMMDLLNQWAGETNSILKKDGHFGG